MKQLQAAPASDSIRLSRQQTALSRSAIFAAAGEMDSLRAALTEGLDARLTISELTEALVQLYAYCGFPRSLNALQTLMDLVAERRDQGIPDQTGRSATPLTGVKDKYELGRQTLEFLTMRPQQKPTMGVNAFAPAIDTFLKEHLFADIFGRDVLTYQQRELVTISALASMEGVAAQLRSHLGIGMNVGLHKNQLEQVADLVRTGRTEELAVTAREALAELLESRKH